MIALFVAIGCGSDPCSWAYGDWRQTRTEFRGAVIAEGSDARLALQESGFGYRLDGAPTVEAAILTPVDPDCLTLDVTQEGANYRLTSTDAGLSMDAGGHRVYRFERAE